MLNEDKVKQMTKLAMMEQQNGNKCKPMREYFRSDYISREMLLSFISGTLAYIVMIALYLACTAEELLESLQITNLQGILVTAILAYIVFMAVYFGITYVVYNIRYTAGRKKVKEYYMEIKKINKIYSREE